ncbi:MAG: acetyl-CoA carboxylase biotin carboxylase subunit [Candidatus Brocadiaceae bacterium]|nr:acetyl-CoA carboxylase biotin carboxylase subunit [Candidatus Brocadiaceae bacterium]
MFTRVLVANRGEIALRIIRACKELGVEAVAVYSKADAGSQYLELADDSVCIGPAPPAESYLNVAHIISAAEVTNVDAIHPGYGFLAEDDTFAEICEESNIVFIGPRSDVMRKMGNKAEARRIAKENRVPVIPGSEGVVGDEDEALGLAHQLGYPVMIKAAAGGGGRGMRIAHNDISLKNMLALARNEAGAAFKDSSVYVEKVVSPARHVEVQILGDSHGNVLHLGERDCSIQRRFQKLIEETPSPGIDSDLRSKITRAAVRIARAVNYTGAGTIEFLVNPEGQFFFIEMNTRLQVEHPVTEEVTGLDLVKEQIRIAAGEELTLQQKRVEFRGCAIECRINAENPADGFRASPGTVRRFNPPGGRGVRIDSHCYSGYEVKPCYDSMIGKLIVHQPTRAEALACLRRALTEFTIEGIHTTIPFYRDLINHGGYASGRFDTHFVEDFLEGA